MTKLSVDAEELARIGGALQRWFESQGLGPDKALDVMNASTAVLLASMAKDWPHLMDGLTYMHTQMTELAKTSFQSLQDNPTLRKRK